MQLRLEGLTKQFDGFRLQPFTVTIEPGEFFCLLGPSGCGKTTVLRLIGGFETPTSGRVFLGNENITELPPHKRNIHTVFQRYALFPHLNVFENVAFSLRLKKLPNAEIETRTIEALRLVEIENLRSRKIHQLSGGQMQRVAVARAIVGRPSVLLLDEPLSALDPALRVKMREELRSLCKKVGITFVMVTHDQEEALQLSDRLAVFRDGQCLQIGTPKTIYEYPVDPFVASFIGPVNQIPKEEGCLCLRPEKMRILRQKSSTHENLLEGEILDLSYLGSRTEYSVKSGNLTLKVFEPELERLKKRSLNQGDKIYITWRKEDAILLPNQPGPPTDKSVGVEPQT